MPEKSKNARPSAATLEQAAELAHGEAAFSCSYSTTQHGRIASLLPCGEENAIPAADLARLVGAKSVRDLQEQIAAERHHGSVILSRCSHGGGYYRPAADDTGRAEIQAYIRTLEARASNTFAALKSAKEALASMPGQITLEDSK